MSASLRQPGSEDRKMRVWLREAAAPSPSIPAPHSPSGVSVSRNTICPVWSHHLSYFCPSILPNLLMFLQTLWPDWEGCTLAQTGDRSAAAQPISIRLHGRLLESGGAGRAAANNLLYRKMKITWHESVFCLLVSRHGCQPGQSSAVPDHQSQTHQQVLPLLHTNIHTLNSKPFR